MATLKFRQDAKQALQFFREDDPKRGEALDAALDILREGKGRVRSRRDGEYNAWLMDVWIPGRDDYDLVIWDEKDDDVIAIIHVGRSKL